MIHFFQKTHHHEPTFIFSYEDINYLAADEDGIRGFEGDLVINLTGHPGPKSASTTYKIASLAKHMMPLPDEIVLAWEDFGGPPVKNSFWLALHEHIKKKKYKFVCFRCLHGHGRTGTSLAAMKVALQGCDTLSAIQDVREVYCTEAVESDAQVLYLLQLDWDINSREMLGEEEIRELLTKVNPKPIPKLAPRGLNKPSSILDDDDSMDWNKLFHND